MSYLLKKASLLTVVATGGLFFSLTFLQGDASTETGTAKYLRNHDEALAQAKQTNKPVFAFFQEVPGWAGCKVFGREVMTNPIIVDAVENSFVPLLTINNKKGKDAEILKKYNEPAWNYQVVRFLNADGKDLIPRRDNINTQHALSTRMISALEKAKQPVPKTLQLLNKATDSSKLAQAAFSCHCYWTGEYKLGGHPGVMTTEAGWLDGHEVTLVSYRTDIVSITELIKYAQKQQVANSIYLSTAQQKKEAKSIAKNAKSLSGYRKAKPSDQKRQIGGTPYSKLKLSPEQACKVNAFCRSNPAKAISFLTTKQKAQLKNN